VDKRIRNLDESILGKSRLLISLAFAFPGGAAPRTARSRRSWSHGTRIARASADASSPIVVIEARAFEESPAVSVEATLNEFPQFAPSAGAASVDPASDGLATVSLRGLGANRTLVLLEGRRLVPADGLGQVDLNILAPELIESVDVVTGGASAVYGSDAVAGVVNSGCAGISPASS
jgi:outer membrane receptor protein involved in Fe transport